MKKCIYSFILFCLCFSISNSYAQKISSYLYGQNYWIAEGDEKGRPGYIDLLWPQVEKSGIDLIRIGGNGYLDLPERKRLNQMVDSVQSIGAEPLLQIPRTFTAQQTRELVRYYNKSNRKPIKYWCIGNEPLHSQHNLKIEQVYTYIKEIAPAVKDVDENVKIFIFDEASLNEEAYRSFCGGIFDVTGKNPNGTWMIDGFAFHNYPNGHQFDRDDVIFTGPVKIKREVVSLKKMMKDANKKHNRVGDYELLWALTEVNVTYVNPDREISGFGNPSFLGGQFIAEMFALGMEYGAFTVSPWCISETDQVQTDFGYIGFPKEFYPRSSYYHTKMMSEYIVGNYVKSISNQGYVKTVASVTDSGLSILIMNQDNLRNFSFDIYSNANTLISDKPLFIALNTDINIDCEGYITNQTSLLLVFNREGRLTKKITYGLDENLKNLEPKLECY